VTVQCTVGSLCAPPRTPGFSGFTVLLSAQFLLASAAARLLGLRVRKSPEAWSSICCECCVVSGRGLCDGPIPRVGDSRRVCVCVLHLQ
jgi:hypothetical protein